MIGIFVETNNSQKKLTLWINCMNYDVISVEALDYLKLKVFFKDNTSGDVIITEKYLTGVFEALKNKQLFFEVNCRHGFVEWPGELDLAPDAMYDAIINNGSWVLE